MSERKILNILMTVMFFVELASNFFQAELHEIIGIIFFCAVLIHNFQNKHFYKNLLRGKFTLNKICIILFGLGILILTFSGLILAGFIGKEISCYNWRAIHLNAAIFTLIFMFCHLIIHARKYFKKKIFYGAAICSFILAVAGIFGLPYLDRWFHKVEVNRTEILQGEKISTNKKILTVYFSRVGNTNFSEEVDAVSGASIMKDKSEIIGNAQMIALMVQNILGGEIFELQTEKIYPEKYSATTEVAHEEFLNGELPKLKSLPEVKNFDTIILIYPLWWGDIPKSVENFLIHSDLRGKILVPIVTHGGGGFGKSLETLKNSTDAEVTEAIEIYSSDIPDSRKNIFEFLRKITA